MGSAESNVEFQVTVNLAELQINDRTNPSQHQERQVKSSSARVEAVAYVTWDASGFFKLGAAGPFLPLLPNTPARLI